MLHLGVWLGFERPQWLWALLVAAPMVLVGLALLRTMSGARRWSAVVLRAGLVVLLAGMLAGVTLVRQTDRLAVIAVVDVSDSVRAFGGAEAIERARAWLREAAGDRGPDDLLGVVVFNGVPAVIAPPLGGVPGRAGSAGGAPVVPGAGGIAAASDGLDRPWEVAVLASGRDGTDLAAALRLAGSAFPADARRRIVVVSDGNQTQGDALAAAAGLPRGVPVDVLPIRYEVTNEIIVESVGAPARAPAGSTATLSVSIRSSGPAAGVLRVLVNGEAASIGPAATTGRRVELKAGTNVVLVNVPLAERRQVHRFTAVFEPDVPGPGAAAVDTVQANNRADAFTVSPDGGTVLVVDGVSGGSASGAGATLPGVLRRAGLQADVAGPEGLPTDLLRLQEYSLVVLQDVAAGSVSAAQQQALVTYVSEFGGGLVVSGGPSSYAAGGWRRSLIEPILPVELELPERLVVPTLALMIVLDTSGSMSSPVLGSSRSQQDVANEGAALAVRSLDRQDLVGVIEFNSWHRVVVPLGPNADVDTTVRRVLSLTPGGGTNGAGGLAEAVSQLQKADAKVRHVIYLSDGRDSNTKRLDDVAAEAVKQGVRVSTIAVGDAADAAGLDRMSKFGGGEFYRVTDPSVLPQVFLRAVQLVRTPQVREEPFVPVVPASGSPVTAGLPREMPELGGLNLTQARPARMPGSARPTNVTYAMLSDRGEPLLAHWPVGLGQVAAWTSDAHDKWAAKWLAWPGYTRLWTQLVRAMARAQGSRLTDLAVTVEGEEVRLRVEAADAQGRPMDSLSIAGTVFGPDGERLAVRMSQEGPGVYTARVPSGRAGNYIAALVPRGSADGSAMPPVVGGVAAPSGREYRAPRSNEGLLRQVAAATGGRELSIDNAVGARLFDREGVPPREARLPWWPVLLAWAVAVFVLDVGTRRVAWDRLLGGRFSAEGGARGASAGGGAARTSEAMGRVRQAVRREMAATPVAAETGAAQTPAARASAAAPAGERGASTAAAEPAAPVEQPGESSFAAAKRRARERIDRDRRDDQRPS